MFKSESASRSALFFLQIIWLLSLQAFLSNVFGSNFEKPREGERVSMKYVCIVFFVLTPSPSFPQIHATFLTELHYYASFCAEPQHEST